MGTGWTGGVRGEVVDVAWGPRDLGDWGEGGKERWGAWGGEGVGGLNVMWTCLVCLIQKCDSRVLTVESCLNSPGESSCSQTSAQLDVAHTASG